MPARWTRTSASPAPGRGSGASRASASRVPSQRSARMVTHYFRTPRWNARVAFSAIASARSAACSAESAAASTRPAASSARAAERSARACAATTPAKRSAHPIPPATPRRMRLPPPAAFSAFPQAAYTCPARVSCTGACLPGRRSSSILAAGSRPLRMVPDPLLVALALGLVVVNAFFVAAEFAMVRVRATRVEALAAEGHWQARLAATLHRRLDVFLSATQLGITLTSLGLGWIGEPAFAHPLAPVFAALGIESARVIENTSIAVAFATITFLHIVVGELAPKSFAIRFTERVALLTAPPMRLFQILFAPALWLLHRASKATLSVLGVSAETSGDLAHSEDELRILLAESHRVGALSGAKRQLLENVIDYTERTARHVMVPRADIAYLSLARSLEENLDRKSTRLNS